MDWVQAVYSMDELALVEALAASSSVASHL